MCLFGAVFLPFGHEDLLLELCPLGSEYFIVLVSLRWAQQCGKGSSVSCGHCCSEELGQGYLGFEEITMKCLLCLLGFGGRWRGHLWSVDWY